MGQKLIALVFYAGMDKKHFDEIKPELEESARKNLQVFTLVATVVTALLVVAGEFRADLSGNRSIYLFVAVCSFIIYLLSRTLFKKFPACVPAGLYLFIGTLYVFGIYLANFITPDEMTVSFIVLLFAVPLVFADRPINMVIANCIAIGIYLICAYAKQSTEMFGYNLTNIIAYGLISILTTVYMMKVKAERYAYEKRTRFLSESDQLTGMLNRRSFEQNMSRYRESGSSAGLTICAFDVNGLKTVNDTLGHAAGDELIRGAANCLETVFGRYGTCYRTGGDEFMAILTGQAPTEEELTRMLVKQTQSWKGMLVSGMSISIGIVRGSEDLTVDAAENLADKKMYAYKAEYYKQTGNDRRHR